MRTTLTLPDDRDQSFYNKSETSMNVGYSSIYLLGNELQTGIIHKGFITLSWVWKSFLFVIMISQHFNNTNSDNTKSLIDFNWL